MPITELFNYFKNRNEQIRQEIASETGQFIKAIQPYADEMGYSKYWLDLIRSEDPIGDTEFRSIMLRMKEENRLRCWFLQSDGGGFKTGDLQVTMTYQPAKDGTNPLTFETIGVFKLPRKEERHWLPLKPADQLKNLKLANECLEIFRFKETSRTCGNLLSQAIDLYPRLGPESLSVDLLADYQRPLQAKAYQFSELKVSLDEDNQNLVVLDLQTEARLHARATFNRKESELIYHGLQILNDQKTPPVWEAPTSPVAEIRIIEATSEALKQILSSQF